MSLITRCRNFALRLVVVILAFALRLVGIILADLAVLALPARLCNIFFPSVIDNVVDVLRRQLVVIILAFALRLVGVILAFALRLVGIILAVIANIWNAENSSKSEVRICQRYP